MDFLGFFGFRYRIYDFKLYYSIAWHHRIVPISPLNLAETLRSDER
jgi:hypothetical protein